MEDSWLTIGKFRSFSRKHGKKDNYGPSLGSWKYFATKFDRDRILQHRFQMFQTGRLQILLQGKGEGECLVATFLTSLFVKIIEKASPLILCIHKIN